MTLSLELPPELARDLTSKAEQVGLPLERYVIAALSRVDRLSPRRQSPEDAWEALFRVGEDLAGDGESPETLTSAVLSMRR